MLLADPVDGFARSSRSSGVRGTPLAKYSASLAPMSRSMARLRCDLRTNAPKEGSKPALADLERLRRS